MPDPRVGSLDNPQRVRHGCRSMAVYENSTGFYYKLDGSREKVHGNQLWTTLGNIKMRGYTRVDAPAANGGAWQGDWDDDWDGDHGWEAEEERQIAAAIAASLQDDVAMPEAPAAGDAAGDNGAGEGGTGDAAGNGNAAGDAASNGASRECSICLTEPSVMLMRPCNHVCACPTCSRRLLRHPCPLCRRLVTKVERVYF